MLVGNLFILFRCYLLCHCWSFRVNTVKLICHNWLWSMIWGTAWGCINKFWVVVVAQLIERSLPTPEVCCSNPVIGEIFIELSNVLKRQNKEKEGGNGPFKKQNSTPFWWMISKFISAILGACHEWKRLLAVRCAAEYLTSLRHWVKRQFNKGPVFTSQMKLAEQKIKAWDK